MKTPRAMDPEITSNEECANIMTFRTEVSADNKRVPALLEALGVKLLRFITIKDPLIKGYEMGCFTIEIHENQTDRNFKIAMENEIQSNDAFVDLHRCHQTLRKGSIPSW